MIKDEFNQVEIKNDQEVSKVEFGKVQKSEATSQKENKLPEGDLNEKYVGKTVKKVTEVNVEYTNKVPNHGITVVKSTATATTAASAISSAVVAASTVAVVAIATVTGVTAALREYDFRMNSLVVSANEIFYSVSISTDKHDDNYLEYLDYEEGGEGEEYGHEPYLDREGQEPFVIQISNDEYHEEQYLWYGLNQSGYFSNLVLGNHYNIVVKENKEDGEVLFDKTVETYENSTVRDLYIDNYLNYYDQSFGLSIDYIDDLDKLENFSLYLTPLDGNDRKPIIFPLEKQSYQSISYLDTELANYIDNSQLDFGCKVVYQKGEESYRYPADSDLLVSFIYYEPEIYPDVYGVDWDKTANFADRSFNVKLEYYDFKDQISKFTLTLTDIEDANISEVFELSKTTEEQTVILPSTSQIDLSRTYKYIFEYEYDGQTTIIESGEVTFEDNAQEKSEFYGLDFDGTANFINRTFIVKLDYVDDYGYFGDIFTLILTDEDENEIEIELEKSLDEQIINADEYDINLRKQYTYVVKCENNSVLETVSSGTMTFTDNSGAVVAFYNLSLDKKANFLTRSFDITLDYQDDLDYLSDFVFTLEDTVTNEIVTYELEKKTEAQTITVDQKTTDDPTGEETYLVDITEHPVKYTFSYYDDSDDVQQTVTTTSEEFYFKNSAFDFESSFDFTHDDSDPTGTGSTGSDIGGDSEPLYLLPAKISMDNGYGEINDLEIEVYNQSSPDAIGYFSCEEDTILDNEWHYLYYHPYGGNTFESLLEEEATIEITITNSEEERITVCKKSASFTKDQTNEIYNLVIVDTNVTAGDYILPYRIVYSGDPSTFIDPELVIETSGNTYTYSVFLEGLNNVETVPLSSPIEMNFDEEAFESELSSPVKVSIVYHTSINEEVSIVCYEELSIFIH